MGGLLRGRSRRAAAVGLRRIDTLMQTVALHPYRIKDLMWRRCTADNCLAVIVYRKTIICGN